MLIYDLLHHALFHALNLLKVLHVYFFIFVTIDKYYLLNIFLYLLSDWQIL